MQEEIKSSQVENSRELFTEGPDILKWHGDILTR